MRLSNAKVILVAEQQWYDLTHSLEYKEAHTFNKDISLKVNVKMQLEFEIVSYEER